MTVALMLVKKQSSRLKDKNWLDFKDKPMFQWNLEKCLKIFKKVYVSSDYEYILKIANSLGAIPLKRPLELCGNVPNIPVYQYVLKQMMTKPDIIVAVQANSPTIKCHLIQLAKDIMEQDDVAELMTCHPDGKVYGSIWALQTWALEKYDNYKSFKDNHTSVYITDTSVDIHTLEDFNKALQIKHI